VRLRREVDHRVDVVALQAVDYLGRIGHVALVEGKVAPVVEDARVVEGRAVVQLVEGDDVVSVRVGEGEVPDEPACASTQSVLFERRNHR
jgi:hypothetical protein